jgi:hypothetical protein|tara:strand:+ start:224 stop:412 length:189 start_codon:yes stop_codon:yes gene_type:complete
MNIFFDNTNARRYAVDVFAGSLVNFKDEIEKTLFFNRCIDAVAECERQAWQQNAKRAIVRVV